MPRDNKNSTVRMLRRTSGAHNIDLRNVYEAVAAGTIACLYIGASSYVSLNRGTGTVTFRVYKGDDRVGTYLDVNDIDCMDAIEEVFNVLDEQENLRIAQDLVAGRRSELAAKARGGAQRGKGAPPASGGPPESA